MLLLFFKMMEATLWVLSKNPVTCSCFTVVTDPKKDDGKIFFNLHKYA